MNRNPWDDDIEKLFRKIMNESYFREPLSGSRNRANVRSNYREPVTDFWQTQDQVIITSEIPGVEKEDIDINVTEKDMEIRVEKENTRNDNIQGRYRLKTMDKGFYKYLKLPVKVDPDTIQATYNNGVLEIKIEIKEGEKKSSKKVDVE